MSEYLSIWVSESLNVCTADADADAVPLGSGDSLDLIVAISFDSNALIIFSHRNPFL